MYAANVPLTIQGITTSYNFRGGIKVRVEINPNDPYRSVRLKVIEFRMEADVIDLPITEMEANNIDSSITGIGKVIIEKNDIDVTPESLLRLTQNFPPKYEQIMVLRFTMTIDAGPDDSTANSSPRTTASTQLIALETKNPAVIVGNLTQFPPRGDLYQLQNPIDLVLPEVPDVTIASIQKFPVKVGGI